MEVAGRVQETGCIAVEQGLHDVHIIRVATSLALFGHSKVSGARKYQLTEA